MISGVIEFCITSLGSWINERINCTDDKGDYIYFAKIKMIISSETSSVKFDWKIVSHSFEDHFSFMKKKWLKISF